VRCLVSGMTCRVGVREDWSNNKQRGATYLPQSLRCTSSRCTLMIGPAVLFLSEIDPCINTHTTLDGREDKGVGGRQCARYTASQRHGHLSKLRWCSTHRSIAVSVFSDSFRSLSMLD
jgi:hypothetical protein